MFSPLGRPCAAHDIAGRTQRVFDLIGPVWGLDIVKPTYLLPDEIADLLRVPSSLVGSWIGAGRLAAERHGGAVRVAALSLAHCLLRQGMALPERLRALVHLLVIDDEAQVLRAMARSLRRSAPHLEVSLSEGAGNGLRDVRAKRPDVVLVDMYMPELDGVDLCARIKELPETANVQVIGLSCQRDVNMESAFKRAGASTV